ncbi:reverse transcriptase domain-containing protein [Tanacetum coccineum]
MFVRKAVCLETHVPFGLLMIWLRGNGAGQQVVMSQDGSGNFAPNNSAGYFVVYVTARFYEKYVNIPKNKKYLMMIGDGINQTVIPGNHRVINGWTTFNSATFNWLEELPHVLWAHRTMIKSSNGETPFSLTYGTEAVIPAEIGMPTLRTTEVDQANNNEALGINLDLIEERREQAAIQEAKSKKKMEKYYNSRVRGTSFKPGEMVYRSNEASHAQDGGKLGPKWEGPYEVKESLGKGAYKLKDRKGNDVPRTWNICNLKKCYIHEM